MRQRACTLTKEQQHSVGICCCRSPQEARYRTGAGLSDPSSAGAAEISIFKLLDGLPGCELNLQLSGLSLQHHRWLVSLRLAKPWSAISSQVGLCSCTSG